MTRKAKHTLSGLLVRHAMRRQIVILPQESSIDHSINHLVKYKVNALLVSSMEGIPVGVVTKTDIMGAYYAGIPIDTPLMHIMIGPPIFCRPEDPLEAALDTMRGHHVYRLYVADEDADRIIGALAYPDIVGLLYKYCHNCEYSGLRRNSQSGTSPAGIRRLVVEKIMSREVRSVASSDPLLRAMEVLSSYRFGAVLVKDGQEIPCGVISKTDLALAYKHGVSSQTPVNDIMSTPIHFCHGYDLLETAIKTMIYSDTHRLFVKARETETVVGVFSLTDAARHRSGSCHACISSRIQLEQ